MSHSPEQKRQRDVDSETNRKIKLRKSSPHSDADTDLLEYMVEQKQKLCNEIQLKESHFNDRKRQSIEIVKKLKECIMIIDKSVTHHESRYEHSENLLLKVKADHASMDKSLSVNDQVIIIGNQRKAVAKITLPEPNNEGSNLGESCLNSVITLLEQAAALNTSAASSSVSVEEDHTSLPEALPEVVTPVHSPLPEVVHFLDLPPSEFFSPDVDEDELKGEEQGQTETSLGHEGLVPRSRIRDWTAEFFKLEQCGTPAYMLVFAFDKELPLEYGGVERKLPAFTPILCYSDSDSVFLKNMETDEILTRYWMLEKKKSTVS